MNTRVDYSRLPDERAFFEAAVFPARISKPNRAGWSMSTCPQHRSRSGKPNFGINVIDWRFHCFSPDCGIGGKGVISFVMAQHHCDFKRACKILGVWLDGGLTDQERVHLQHQQQERERNSRSRPQPCLLRGNSACRSVQKCTRWQGPCSRHQMPLMQLGVKQNKSSAGPCCSLPLKISGKPSVNTCSCLDWGNHEQCNRAGI